MVVPFFGGIPGGIELTILVVMLVIPLAFGYFIGTDAKQRGSSHEWAWGIFAFLIGFTLWGLLLMGIFYWVVREDIGEKRSR